MKLHSPDQERRLRRVMRQTIRGNPALRRAARAGRRSRHVNFGWGAARVFVLAILGSLIMAFGSGGNRTVDAQLALATIWFTSSILFFPEILRNHLYMSADHYQLAHWPVGQAELFAWQWSKARYWTWWVFWESLVLYVIVGLSLKPSVWVLVAAPLAALVQRSLLVGLGLWLCVRVSSWYTSIAGLGLLGTTLAIFMAKISHFDVFQEWFVKQADAINLLSPAGWIGLGFGAVSGVMSVANVGFLALAAVLLWVCRGAMEEVRRQFLEAPAPMIDFPNSLSGLSQEDWQEFLVKEGHPGAPNAGPTEIEDRIHSREFLSSNIVPVEAKLDLISNRLASSRQRLLLDQLSGAATLSKATWSLGRFFFVIGLLLIFTSPWWHEQPFLYSFLLMILSPFAQQAGRPERAFVTAWSGGLEIPVHALLPVGYFELGWLTIQRAVLQWLAVVPAATLVLLVLAWAFTRVVPSVEWPRLQTAILDGAKAQGFMLATAPAIVGAQFLQLSGGNWRTLFTKLILVSAIVVTIVVSVGLGIATFVAANLKVWIALTVVECSVCLVAFLVGGWVYNHGRIDLIKVPPQEA